MNEVLLAPFSNSDIRDWPSGHYARLAGLLLRRLPTEVGVTVVGSAGQRLKAHEVVRPHPSPRVTNACGRLPWAELVERLRTAWCVVGNNSGIAHLAGRLGAPTVCVFGGSHPREQWRPVGPSVLLVSRAIGCSPCQLDHNTGSPYRKACLWEVEPEVVAAAVLSAAARLPGRADESIAEASAQGFK